MSKFLQRFFIFICFGILVANVAYAGIETTVNQKKGVLATGDIVEVKDEKFKNPSFVWSSIQNRSVKNSVYLRLVGDEAMPQAFSCEVDVRIEYYQSPTESYPHVIPSKKLQISYLPGVGTTYKAEDVYYMTGAEGAYEVKVIINGISSPQFGSLLPYKLELGATVVVDRFYTQSATFPFVLTGAIQAFSEVRGSAGPTPTANPITSTLNLQWSIIEPSEEYDIEWTVLDEGAELGVLIDEIALHGAPLNGELSDIFRNNAARITTQGNSFSIPLIYNSKYILVRIRAVNYDSTTGIRNETGSWNYKTGAGSGAQYAIWDIGDTWHESKLNWQYNSMYAEEGKKKEIISYFDGSLRNRQTVTINNSDEIAVVQENIYDAYGRTTASVLPAPIISSNAVDKTLKYFPALNKNSNGTIYSDADLNFTNCEPLPSLMSTGTGASRYFSNANELVNVGKHRYIPNAEGYPFSVIQYTNDPTGRIRLQGGVGSMFQPAGTNQSKTTKYFYGKPEQWELDRIFGSDAGLAERYLKNMVADPNGSLSISYVNAAGKTVATALTGDAPSSQDALSTAPAPFSPAAVLLNTTMFNLDQTSLKIMGSTTYVSSIVGQGLMEYDIEQLVSQYQRGNYSLQNNAYYQLHINITDNCGRSVYDNANNLVTIGSDQILPLNNGKKRGSLTPPISLVEGEYFITFTLAMDRSVILKFADDFIQKAQDAGAIDSKFKIVKKYLQTVDLSNCYSECNTCDQLLGENFEFIATVKKSLAELGFDAGELNPTELADLDALLTTKYNALKAACNVLKQQCKDAMAVSPCETYKRKMRIDVSPGGQYALFKTNYTALELSLNALAKTVDEEEAWRKVFPKNAKVPGDEEYEKNKVYIEELGEAIAPYHEAFKLAYLVKYWKPEWADLFLMYHPEYCKLQQCENVMQPYLKWDRRIQENILTNDDIKLINGGVGYDRNNLDWLMQVDPFFSSGMFPEMIEELQDYSHITLKFPEEVDQVPLVHRTLTAYVDYVTYCNQTGVENVTLWNATCTVLGNCRVVEREWQNYKNFYFSLKEKYYQKYYKILCGNECPIGVSPMSPKLNKADGCLPSSDFLIEKYQVDPLVSPPINCNGNIIKVSYKGGQSGQRNVYLQIAPEYNYTGTRHLLFDLQNGSQYLCLPTDIPIEALSIKSACITPQPNYRALLTAGVWSFQSASRYGWLPFKHKFNADGSFVENGIASGNWSFNEDTDMLTFDGESFHIESISENVLVLSHYVGGEYEEVYYTYLPDVHPMPDFKYVERVLDPSDFGISYILDRFPYDYAKYRIVYDIYDPDYDTATPPPYVNFWAITKNSTQKYTNNRLKMELEKPYYISQPTASETHFHITPYIEFNYKLNNPPVITGITYLVRPNVGVKFGESSPYTVKVIMTYYTPSTGYTNEEVEVEMDPITNTGVFFLPDQVYNVRREIQRFHVETNVKPYWIPNVSPCNPLLAKKIPVFPRIDDFSGNSTQYFADLSVETQDKAYANAQETLGQQIDLLISKLSPAPPTTLRNQLLTIGMAAFGVKHPEGASTTANSASGLNASNSFYGALKAAAPNNQFSLSFNPWLVSSPYPYDMQPRHTAASISRTNDANDNLCARLTQIRQLLGDPTTTTAFYQALKAKFGNAMTLDLAELTDLVNNCNSSTCYGVLKFDIALPVFLEPKGYVTHQEYQNAVNAFRTEIVGLPNDLTTLSEADRELYEDALSTYLNHKWGFTMGFADYRNYENEVIKDANKLLINKRPFDTLYPDVAECIKPRLSPLLYNAMEEYRMLIAEERKLFLQAYVSNCAAPEIEVTLKTQQKIYHYTLYYYDQANNLVRTVPPEGVRVLNASETLQVAASRNNKNPNCTYSGPTVEGALANAKNSLQGVLGGTAGATELWMYQANANGGQTLIQVNKHYILNYCISEGKLSVALSTLDPNSGNGSIVITSTKYYSGNIGTIMPWNHLVLQGSNMQAQTGMQLWFNGTQLTLDDTAPTCGWEIAGNPPALGEDISKLKHLRTYNRMLTTAEIKANASNGCLMPQAPAVDYAWYRFNIPAAGGPTTVDPNSTQENPFKELYPKHQMVTYYAYNSTGQVVKQQTPDAGESLFWYDPLSRLLASRNARQTPGNKISYTDYDHLGRIVEVGQLIHNNALPAMGGFLNSAEMGSLTTLLADNTITSTKTEITKTFYDEAPSGSPGLQENLRTRVTASVYKETPGTNVNGSYYSYDIAGNVKRLYQSIIGLDETKTLDYEYDLISGKVNFLAYQKDRPDQFFYQYKYDAENRLTEAWSGIRASIRPIGFGSAITPADHGRKDAEYFYYLHGPLARLELGSDEGKVQGIDYAYTLQGWLKGVNGQALSIAADMGGDGPHTGRDVFAFSLGYYNGDYNAIGASAGAFARKYVPATNDVSGKDLFNGNISNAVYAIDQLGAPVGYTYGYDHLNRLKRFRQHPLGSSTGNWNAISLGAAYSEDFSYDANGNILTLNRNKHGGSNMDNLTYGYNLDANGRLLNNRLNNVIDDNANSAEIGEFRGATNFTYDAIGNLTGDSKAGISNINWNVYGKIKQIAKTLGNINYQYDATGNRVSKSNDGLTSYYVRDVQGNTLAVYDREVVTNTLYWKEQQLYGSSRLGLWKPNLLMGASTNTSELWSNIGLKNYELTNHLGNVMVVISDKRIPLRNGTYEAEVINANDYYAFGSQMPGRSINLGNYRYGFNGKENDNEVKGEGNQQDYGMRIYDPRIGKFLSVDPLSMNFPYYTPYQFAGNKPIIAIDLDGAEEAIRINYHSQKEVKTQLILVNDKILQGYAQGLWNRLIPYPNGKFNKDNTTFVRGLNDYTYGNKDYSYIQLRPSTGQLTIDITGSDYFFSYNKEVKKDMLYQNTLREYTFGESYDRANGLSEMGAMSSRLALASLAIPVIGEGGFAAFNSAGKVLSGIGDGTEIIVDFIYGKKRDGLGKAGLWILGEAIGKGVDTHNNKNVADVTNNIYGNLMGEVKSSIYETQQKPSANGMRKEWRKSMEELTKDK
jgi:RHS repeat-associated protein